MARGYLVTSRNGRKAVLLDVRTLSTVPVSMSTWAIISGSSPPDQDYRIVIHRWEIRDGKAILTVGNVVLEDVEADLEVDEADLSPPKGKGWRWDFGEWVRDTRKGREACQP